MRNNTKLIRLLKDNDVNLTYENKEIVAVVTHRLTGYSYVCQNTSITNVLNEAERGQKAIQIFKQASIN